MNRFARLTVLYAATVGAVQAFGFNKAMYAYEVPKG